MYPQYKNRLIPVAVCFSLLFIDRQLVRSFFSVQIAPMALLARTVVQNRMPAAYFDHLFSAYTSSTVFSQNRKSKPRRRYVTPGGPRRVTHGATEASCHPRGSTESDGFCHPRCQTIDAITSLTFPSPRFQHPRRTSVRAIA